MNNPWVHIAKYGVIALIWSGVLVFGIFLTMNTSLFASESSPAVAMVIAAFITAAVSTGLILSPSQHEEKTQSQQQVSTNDTAKPKNDLRGLDPMSLLTDEDIEELRRDIKDNLRRRLLEGEEVTSFESLLSEDAQAPLENEVE